MSIRNPIEWGMDQVRGAGTTLGSLSREMRDADAQPERPSLSVNRIDTNDIRAALAQGFQDFAANRTDVIFVCIVYPVLGLVFGRMASGYDMLPLLFPLASGFALVGPFTAIGLYEMSRKRERGRAAASRPRSACSSRPRSVRWCCSASCWWRCSCSGSRRQWGSTT